MFVATLFAVLLTAAACGASPKASAAAPTDVAVAAPVPADGPVKARAPGSPRTVDDVATEIVEHINANEGAAVFALFAGSMAQIRPIEKTKAYIDKVHSAFGRLGAKTRVSGASAASDGVYRVSAEHGACLLELHLTPRGQVIGITVRGESGR